MHHFHHAIERKLQANHAGPIPASLTKRASSQMERQQYDKLSNTLLSTRVVVILIFWSAAASAARRRFAGIGRSPIEDRKRRRAALAAALQKH